MPSFMYRMRLAGLPHAAVRHSHTRRCIFASVHTTQASDDLVQTGCDNITMWLWHRDAAAHLAHGTVQRPLLERICSARHRLPRSRAVKPCHAHVASAPLRRCRLDGTPTGCRLLHPRTSAQSEQRLPARAPLARCHGVSCLDHRAPAAVLCQCRCQHPRDDAMLSSGGLRPRTRALFYQPMARAVASEPACAG